MKTIICYGDSNTWGFDPVTQQRFARSIRWTGRLQAMLGDEYLVIEEGLNGRTTFLDDPAFPGRNGLSNIDICMQTNAPADVVIIMLGTNDAKRHLKATPFTVAKGVEMTVSRIRREGYGPDGCDPQILIISPIEIGQAVSDLSTGSEFDRHSAELSKEFAAALKTVADGLGCGFINAAQLTAADEHDAVHLNAQGHAALAEAVYHYVLHMPGDDAGL